MVAALRTLRHPTTCRWCGGSVGGRAIESRAAGLPNDFVLGRNLMFFTAATVLASAASVALGARPRRLSGLPAA